MMHQSHNTVLDHGGGVLICVNCSCCECHRPAMAVAPCTKTEFAKQADSAS